MTTARGMMPVAFRTRSFRLHIARAHQLFFSEMGLVNLTQANKNCLLFPGQAAWTPAGVPVRISADPHPSCLSFPVMDKERSFYKHFRVLPFPRLAQSMARQLYQWESTNDEPEARFALREAIRRMLPVWGRSKSLTLPTTEHPKLCKIVAYIHNHMGEPMTLAELAKRFGLSERSFIRLFRRELGLTFVTYLRLARMVRALELLARSGATVTETAYDVGYNSLCAFSEAFRCLVGMRPRDYLKSCRV